MPLEEDIKQAIEISQNSLPLVTGGLRVFLLGLVASVFILGIVLFLLPIVPKMGNVLVMNPIANIIVKIIVWCLTVFVVLGIVCIFYKSARLPSFIIFAVYLIGFVVLAELNDGYKRLDYNFHKDNTPEVRECVITLRKAVSNGVTYKGRDLEGYYCDEEYYQTTFFLSVRFTDNNERYEFSNTNKPMPFFDKVREGAIVRAKVIRGTLKLKYIVGFCPAESQ